MKYNATEMQSILINSKNAKHGREEAQRILNGLKVDRFDITIFEDEKAIGIQDVREIQKKIYLKPFKSEVKAIIINATSGITAEAQNALLKTLEETPEHTIIIVLSPNLEEILPTVISRCKVLNLESPIKIEAELKSSEILLSGKIGEKMKLAQDLSKDKKEALNFLEGSILLFRKNLLNEPSEKSLNTTKILQKYYSIAKSTNTNLRLLLENLFINL